MENNNSLKSNNRGISIVEVVIVLAIMTIVGGAVFFSTTVATDKQVTSCAEKLASSLEQTRNLIMGKQTGWVEISQTPGDYVYVQMYIDGSPYGDRVAVGHPGIVVNITYTDGSTGVLTADGTRKIYFSRNGSVNTSKGNPVSEFEITNGRRTIKIIIDTFTGRIETQRVS